MTDQEQTELKKQVLYDEHTAKSEFDAYIVKLHQMKEQLRECYDRLGTFLTKLDNLERSPEDVSVWRVFPDVKVQEVVSTCDAAISARKKLDGLRSQKQRLGL